MQPHKSVLKIEQLSGPCFRFPLSHWSSTNYHVSDFPRRGIRPNVKNPSVRTKKKQDYKESVSYTQQLF